MVLPLRSRWDVLQMNVGEVLHPMFTLPMSVFAQTSMYVSVRLR
jgi:hypothetical protein